MRDWSLWKLGRPWSSSVTISPSKTASRAPSSRFSGRSSGQREVMSFRLRDSIVTSPGCE
jgi:hypothetical protein